MRWINRYLGPALWAVLACGASGAVFAEAAARPLVDPSINAPYRDPDFESWVETFERPGREVYDKRFAIVQALGLTEGMAVADIGAGTGLFTLLIAAEVGRKGTVYAVDIAETFVRNIERRAAETGLDNVAGIVNDQRSVQLADGAIDLAFISDTYHHFEYPADLMASVYRALRPGGAVVIIDFRKEGAGGWVRQHMRGSEATVIDEVEAVGFEMVEDRDFLATNYYLRFRKPGNG